MKKYLLITLILLPAFVLRVYKLDSYPSLNADEAAIGYNAYSLIQTGGDEHGNPWPIHFESFGDYKPGLYFYLALPFVKYMGLNEWAVRIPGALLGVATVFLIYLLVVKLFPDKKKFSIFNFQFSIGEIAALFLAISPWHIHFSRGAWEVNVSTFFIVSGLYFFVKTFKNPKPINFALCIFSFALSLYTYHSARIIVPLLVLVLLFIYRKEIRQHLRQFVIAGILGFFILLPLAKDMLEPESFSRASGVSIFADEGIISRINERRGNFDDPNGFWARVLHNKPIYYTIEFTQNWLSHYSLEFLFRTGDEIQRNKVPGMGQMYILEALWMVIGVWWLVKNMEYKSVQLITLWLLVAPTAAALTFQSPHALRAQNMVMPLVMISALGFYNLVIWLKKAAGRTKTYPLYLLVIVLVMIFGFVKYLDNYWNRMSVEYPFSSQYGVKELVDYVQAEGNKYEKIFITDRYDQPYILFLFYMKYPPDKFQKDHVLTERDKFGFSTVNHFDKYYFQSINYQELMQTDEKILVAGTEEEMPDEADIIKDIYGTNGYRYFRIVAN
jgi:4-amino-4-deoxy-L-arabinose transferase-like glycosyltransferase